MDKRTVATARALLMGLPLLLMMVLFPTVRLIGHAQGAEADFEWQELGRDTFAANCAACHQSEGQGIPGSFPNLARHLPNLVAAAEGRSLLPQIVLFGMQGAITVGGTEYDGQMPPWKHLSDEAIAATLNHELTAWGNEKLLPDGFELYTPSDVAAARTPELSPAEVHAKREQALAQAQ